jgi:S1-C subfamily serine protease
MCRHARIDHHRSMENVLGSFSANLADLVERAGQSAVAIEARHRIGSSGFLWKSGFIVTAEHAIRRDEDIPVILPGGNRASAELVGRDPGTDIAVLRIDGASAPALTPAPQLRSGEIVLAVGRHGPGALAALGIVSTAAGPWKTWRGGQLDSLLRLDIGAYPRSSGSAVVDTQGRFAGMLTTGLTRTAPVAIPTAAIDRIAAELVEHGRVPRGYLGVGLQPIPLPAAYATLLNRPQRSGVMVLSVEPNGPAENGGILLGDVVVEIGGQPVTDTDDVQIALRGSIGRALPVVVLRSGQRAEFGVTIGERPEPKRTQ